MKNNRINSIFNSSTTAGYRAIITSIKLGSFPSFLFPLLLKGQGDLLGLILRNSIEMHPKKLVNLREKRKIHKNTDFCTLPIVLAAFDSRAKRIGLGEFIGPPLYVESSSMYILSEVIRRA